MNPTTTPDKPRFISRKALIVISGVADTLDFLGFGAFPFLWSVVIDLPVTIVHFLYAGPRAFVVLAEYVPVVGFVPVYTIAALCYDKKPEAAADAGPSSPRPEAPPENPSSPIIDI